jgi:hypothetical protein
MPACFLIFDSEEANLGHQAFQEPMQLLVLSDHFTQGIQAILAND